jgi:hypothetical protein
MGAIMLRGAKSWFATAGERRNSMERLWLRRVVLLGAPLALAILEIFHPERPNSATEAVEQGVWFMWFHFIQLPLIGIIALAVYVLSEGLEGRAVMVSRWAIGVFAVFFSAYDAAAGIGTGYALCNARGLSAGAQEVIYEALKDIAGFEPDLRPLDRGDRCLGGGAGLRVLLRGSCVAGVRTGKPHFG